MQTMPPFSYDVPMKPSKRGRRLHRKARKLADLVARHRAEEALCDQLLTEQDSLRLCLRRSLQAADERPPAGSQSAAAAQGRQLYRRKCDFLRNHFPGMQPAKTARERLELDPAVMDQLDALETRVRASQAAMMGLEQAIMDARPETRSECLDKARFLTAMLFDWYQADVDTIAFEIDDCLEQLEGGRLAG